MQYGKLGSADLAAGVDTLLYTVPAGAAAATCNVRLTNRGSTPILVRVAIGSGASPAAADYLEYDAVVAAHTPLENTGIVMSTGEKLWVRSDTATVSARAHGFEE